MKAKKSIAAAAHKHESAMHKGKPLTPMNKGGAVRKSSGGRLSPFADVSSRNPMAYGAK